MSAFKNGRDDLVSPLLVYSVATDDAIDLASDVVGYAGDRVGDTVIARGSRDPSLIRALPTRHLRGAMVKALPMAIGVQLDDIASINARTLQAFRVGCTAVENLPAPGERLGPTREARLADGRKHTVWSDDELDKLQSYMGRAFMYEVGAVILDRSMGGKARGGAPLYAPPPFLVDVLEKTARLRAEHAKKAAGTGFNDESSDGSTPPPGESSGEAGGAPAASGPTSPDASPR